MNVNYYFIKLVNHPFDRCKMIYILVFYPVTINSILLFSSTDSQLLLHSEFLAVSSQSAKHECLEIPFPGQSRPFIYQLALHLHQSCIYPALFLCLRQQNSCHRLPLVYTTASPICFRSSPCFKEEASTGKTSFSMPHW